MDFLRLENKYIGVNILHFYVLNIPRDECNSNTVSKADGQVSIT